MELENQHIDFNSFRKYYTGAMSTDEKSTFEKNIELDPFAKEAFEGFLVLENDHLRISTIENTNLAIKEKYGILEKKVSIPLKPILGIAASLVLLIGSYFVISNNYNSNNELADNKTKTTAVEQFEEQAEPDHTFTNIENDSSNIIEDSIAKPIMVENIENESEIIDKIIKEEKRSPSGKNKNTKTVEPTNSQSKGNSKKQISEKDYEFYRNNKQAKQNSTDKAINESATEVIAPANKISTSNTIYYEEDKAVTESLSNFKKGQEAFNNNEYPKAIRLFTTSVSQKNEVNSSNYYIGLIHYKQNKPTKAIRYFDKMINSSSFYKDDAKWYKSLSLIRKGQKNDALILLNKIANSNSKYKAAAAVKLKEI